MSSPPANEPDKESSSSGTRPDPQENDDTLSPQEISGTMPSQRSKTGSSSSPREAGGPTLSLQSKEGSSSSPHEVSGPMPSQRSKTGSSSSPHESGGPTLGLRSKEGSSSSPHEVSGPMPSQRSKTGSSSSPHESGGPTLGLRSKEGSSSSPHEASGPKPSQRSKTDSSSSPHEISGPMLSPHSKTGSSSSPRVAGGPMLLSPRNKEALTPSPLSPNQRSHGKTGSDSYLQSRNATPNSNSKKSKDSSKLASFKASENKLGPFPPQPPLKTPSKFDTTQEGHFWYDEIPPSLFRHLPDIPMKLLPDFLNTRRTEILCEDLDSEQRRLLRDERIVRVYCNPISTKIGDSLFAKDVQLLKTRGQKAVSERVKSERILKLRLRKTYGIYGARYEEAKPVKLQRKTLMCDTIQMLAPYSGGHPVHVTPYETLAVKPQTITYQLVDEHMLKVKGIEAGELKHFEAEKIRTTPHAIWKQQRFTSPEGCDFRYLKEQLRRAKYKALLKTAKIAEKNDQLALKSSGLCSNLLPVTSLRHGDEDSVAEPASAPDADNSDTASEEYCYISGEGGFLVKKSLPEVRGVVEKKPAVRAVEPEDVTTENLRRKLAPFLAPQPKGNFFPDPREGEFYKKHCGAQKKR